MIAARWSAVPVQRWSWRRLAVALGASLLAHYLVVGGWPVSGGGRTATVMTPQLHAQLQISAVPLTVPFTESADQPEEPEQLISAPPVAVLVDRVARRSPAAASETQPAAHARLSVPDPRFFPARELDRYPAPLVPLDLRGMGAGGAVRAWVSIDLAGNVVEVMVVDAGPSVALQQQVREQLHAVRFMPGMKDERPVRSRVLMELVYGQ